MKTLFNLPFKVSAMPVICFLTSAFPQWQQTNGPYGGGDIRSFAVSGTNLFAGTYFGGVYVSTNNGAIWTAVNNGLSNMDVSALSVIDTNLFAGTLGGGVFFPPTMALTGQRSTMVCGTLLRYVVCIFL